MTKKCTVLYTGDDHDEEMNNKMPFELKHVLFIETSQGGWRARGSAKIVWELRILALETNLF